MVQHNPSIFEIVIPVPALVALSLSCVPKTIARLRVRPSRSLVIYAASKSRSRVGRHKPEPRVYSDRLRSGVDLPFRRTYAVKGAHINRFFSRFHLLGLPKNKQAQHSDPCDNCNPSQGRDSGCAHAFD